VAFVQYHQLMHQARCSAGPLEELLLHEFLESMVQIHRLCGEFSALLTEAAEGGDSRRAVSP
jgi:hypothetical protein